MWYRLAFLIALLIPRGALPCETALLLAMDVSGSVDSSEYRLQNEGLAAALRDPEIRDIMVQGAVSISVLQWSGPGQQQVMIDWTSVQDLRAAERLAAEVAAMPRAFAVGVTAIGEALYASAAQFARAPPCRHLVADISGDGDENAGFTLPAARQALERAGVQINGLAIEQIGRAVSAFYRARLISQDGFVETADGHLDFARAIRVKLLRELTKPAT
ncbi:DUF1194 domain-containing protein [Falsigemmobacter faecalis]|uniref:DUF1194 domain-containing protein n=1 Tax=Falsigemmobacter faecalis TaxID=2488730 RepID=A0A3P3DD02_9RHOB|nr:DUF1194 domain-containing protein [Falsigemmobacter faecalis]RRH72205.1 DUF1194 domain-containing protein [Falsigemmobacter faecalis]